MNLANDDTVDGFINCLKKGEPCKAEKQKLNSQLSVLADESDSVNSFISPSNEEDVNEEVNGIEDETDYNEDLQFFYSLFFCQSKNLYKQHFEFVNKLSAGIIARVKSF